MTKRAWIIWVAIGTMFLVNAVFGRYLVLPGYLSSLEAGQGTLEGAAQTAPLWKIIRYLLWAYSFKVGMLFAGIGVLLRASIPSRHFWTVLSGGFLYLWVAYVPVPGPYSLFFGIGGSLITLLLVLIFLHWSREYEHLAETGKAAALYLLIGYFFLAMATYNLCPLMGVKAFGLYPDKMIRFGLEREASSFASRIMIELVLGWPFVFLGHRRLSQGSRRSLLRSGTPKSGTSRHSEPFT